MGDHSTGRAAATFARPDWPHDTWFVAAYDVEVGRTLLARTIAGRRLVLYRRLDGSAVALENACWHRLVPLSEGRLDEDKVVCGYHGLEYDADGRCTFMPSQATVNPAARVRSYPVVERDRFVWVWTGDPALADPDRVPDLYWNDHPEWTGDGEVLHVDCSYKLVVDNLMDLTHETYVHASSIGNAAVAETPFEVHHSPDGVRVTRWMLDIDAPPFWAQQLEWRFGRRPGKVDRWQIIDFRPPSTITIDVGVARAGTGAPEGDRSQGVNAVVIDTMTPETEKSCHYFWSLTRNYGIHDQRITTLLRQGNAAVFAEDVDVLAAQQRAIDEHPDKQFYNLNIDAGAMWARRLIERMVDDEIEDLARGSGEEPGNREQAEADPRGPVAVR